MLRFLAFSPLLAVASRSLADGRSGTLGDGVVGSHELRPGAVTPDRLADLDDGRLLGRRLGEGRGAPQSLDVPALRRLVEAGASSWTCRDRATAEGERAPSNSSALILLGYYSGGDGGGAIYVRTPTEPSHEGKLLTADGQWWRLQEEVVTPLMFGAIWNGRADDTDAINACAAYCRASRHTMRLPGGRTYAAGTLFLGGCTVRGAGMVDNFKPNDSVRGSGTIILSDGNPMISTAAGPSQPAWFGPATCLSDFGVGANDGPVPPVELWDEPSYPYQIGLQIGRWIGDIQSIPNDDPTGGGAAFGYITRVAVVRASGWGIYGYKVWGQSVARDLFLRNCGDAGAYAMDDDRRAGGICMASQNVDYLIENVHIYNGRNDDPNEDRRGCGIRLGAYKSDTDALNRTWISGGNQKYRGIFVEGKVVPLDIRAAGSVMLDQMSLEGDVMYLGYGAHPGNDNDIAFGLWRSHNLGEIYIQSDGVDLGQYLGGQGPLEIRYWTGFRASFAKAMPTIRDQSVAITYTPETDATGFSPNGAAGFTPWADVNDQRAEPIQNRLPAFSTAGSPSVLAGWVRSAGSPFVVASARYQVRLYNNATIHYDVTGLKPGDLYTLHVCWETPNAIAGDRMIYSVENGSGVVQISRPLAAGSATYGPSDGITTRTINVRVPADGTLRVKAQVLGAIQAYIRTPILVRGLMPVPHDLAFWPAAGELINTAV